MFIWYFYGFHTFITTYIHALCFVKDVTSLGIIYISHRNIKTVKLKVFFALLLWPYEWMQRIYINVDGSVQEIALFFKNSNKPRISCWMSFFLGSVIYYLGLPQKFIK